MATEALQKNIDVICQGHELAMSVESGERMKTIFHVLLALPKLSCLESGIRYRAIVVILCFFAQQVSAAPANQSEFGELFKACFSYYAAARVCGDPAVTMQAEKNLRRALNWGEFKGLLSEEAKIYLTNPATFIRRGEEHYRRDRYVSCEQVQDTVRFLDGVTRSLP